MELKKYIAPFDATEALEHLEQIFGKVYFEIACNDKVKAELLTKNGFQATGEGLCVTDDFMVKTATYSR